MSLLQLPVPTSSRMEGVMWTLSGAAVPSLNVFSVEMGMLTWPHLEG